MTAFQEIEGAAAQKGLLGPSSARKTQRHPSGLRTEVAAMGISFLIAPTPSGPGGL